MTYYLHLGSNQGDRLHFLNQAIQKISETIGKVQSTSSVYETEPWGLKEQDSFLNMAIKVDSSIFPEDMLRLIKSIEIQIGSAKEIKWGPRKIDIDILYCDQVILESPLLNIPHKHIYNRNFVLIPMIEIAGDFIDPVKNITLDEIYDQCTDESEVFIFEE
jgi:2-amino-4-hydroxy-6-hydroxymethyldihydropteridine diphosphokinase